ncbi:MAG: alginate lyase family protein [Rikenellaceae bacterium]|nr:alginate lyase family protein [Rikenellaceae bacterium]
MRLRYTLYRICHEVEKRTGVLKKRHPAAPAKRHFVTVEQWRSNTPPFVIGYRESLEACAFGLERRADVTSKESVDKIMAGEILFFSSKWIDLGVDYNWIKNPSTGYSYDSGIHWSEIPDLSSTSGDIKYVWEKSRFSWLLTLIRNDYHNGEDHSKFAFSQIERWIDANPVNLGPNWRCSQEISLRILNWCYALHFYKNSGALTEERWGKIQNVIYWSLHHVYNNIDFSRIAVRNNHAITETLFIAMSYILFPFIPETTKWAKDGFKWFEQEIDYQIYDDGTFLQFSMNYHRVVVQLLSFGISLVSIGGKSFSAHVYEKAYKSINFLFQCSDVKNGYLPNYGSNDGAWFFPLSSTDYRDYRPQLNTLHKLLTGVDLYEDDLIREESNWLGATSCVIDKPFSKIKMHYGLSSFVNGGYYLIREKETLSFIKCGSYKDRPAQADNLHLDVWHKGRNILCDAGSYKYNTEEALVKYFSGTESHNTVMLGDYDQMLKGPRFMWFNWSKATDASLIENETHYVFEGVVSCYTYLDKNIVHSRRILKSKESPEWIVCDIIDHKPENLLMRQIWHSAYGSPNFVSEGIEEQTKKGWQSLYYGVKETVRQRELVTTGNRIETKITI